jgi:hypothetical protein
MQIAVRPLRLPAYTGDVAGLLAVYAERHLAQLKRGLPGLHLTGQGKARVQRAPGYELDFNYGHGSTGRDVLVVPPDEPGVRDGLVISLRQTGSAKGRPAVKQVVAATRGAFRSLKFGSDRSD